MQLLAILGGVAVPVIVAALLEVAHFAEAYGLQLACGVGGSRGVDPFAGLAAGARRSNAQRMLRTGHKGDCGDRYRENAHLGAHDRAHWKWAQDSII